MPTFTYQGLSKEEKLSRLKAYMRTITPPEKRGKEMKYTIKQNDGEAVREEKRSRVKAWMVKRHKEYTAGLDGESKEMRFRDATDPKGEREIVFKRGEGVVIEDDHPLFEKLLNLSEGHKPTKKFKEQLIVKSSTFKCVKEEQLDKEPEEPKVTPSKE